MDQGTRAGRGAVGWPVARRPPARRRRALRGRRVALVTTVPLAVVVALLAAAAPARAASPDATARAPITTTMSRAVPTQPAGAQQAAPAASASPTAPTPVAPSIDDQSAITTGSGRFTGRGTPDARVRVADPSTPTASVCSTTVTGDGTWACTGPVRSGPRQVFTVLDTTHDDLAPDDAAPVDVLTPPVVTTTGPTTGGVTGTGYPGARVTVDAGSASRTATISSDGSWYVSWSAGPDALTTGTWTMTATQAADPALGFAATVRSTSSSPVAVTVDRTAPVAPVLTRPAVGTHVRAQPITVAGTGETGDTVTVYVDGNPVCQSAVTATRWSCTTAGSSIPDGTRSFAAGQRDAAGNLSPVSAGRAVVVGGALTDAPSGGPTSSGGDGDGTSGAAPSSPHATGRAEPGLPGGSVRGGPGSGGSGSGASGSGSGTGGGPGGSTGDDASGTGGGGAGARPDDGWTAATAYDAHVPSIPASVSLRTLVLVLVGVAAFLVLVAVPLTLLARSTRGRFRWRLARLTGRNRPVAPTAEGAGALPTWAAVSVSAGVASLLTLFATGIAAEPRYARLAIAVVLGTAVLAVAVVVAARWSAGPSRDAVVVRVSPALVVAALVACLLTRSAHLAPAVLLGVLIVPSVGVGGRDPLPHRHVRLPRRVVALGTNGASARSATVQTGALLALAAIGWLLCSVSAGAGFWHQFLSEFATTLCVGGLGSVVTTLLPVAGSAGAALWATSRARYAAVATVPVALAVAVYSGSTGTHLSLATVGITMGGCAAVAVAVWTWTRVVEPALRD
ncbi:MULTISPECIES: hypothetical protein [unclassified Curtobacterium]|uniref:hypothetical protein n=1 Tax=unclassified Curtobacterium TaxID=257496 RepID=UPI0011B6F80D|nr:MULTISPECIES: hypothetical protein [unclassified Curtobacterium]